MSLRASFLSASFDFKTGLNFSDRTLEKCLSETGFTSNKHSKMLHRRNGCESEGSGPKAHSFSQKVIWMSLGVFDSFLVWLACS